MSSHTTKSSRRTRCANASIVETIERRMMLTAVVVNTAIDAIYPPSTGLISLRNAIATANASTTPTTITFSSSVFATKQDMVLNGTALTLTNTSAPTIITAPAVGLTITGTDQTSSNNFEIGSGVTASFSGFVSSKGGLSNAGNLTLTNVTVQDYVVTSGNYIGGGIYNSGTLSMTGGSILRNSIPGSGGGLYSIGIATLTSVNISSNKATNFGGGILNDGTMTLTDCSVIGNTANAGGGIDSGNSFDRAAETKLTLTNVTISGNTATAAGGGLFADYDGTVVATNVTIANNTAGTYGGGLALAWPGASLAASVTLTNATIAGNKALSGGGVYNDSTADRFTITNSILAGNALQGTGGSGPDALNAFGSLGYNLVGKKDGSTGWNAADRTGTIASPVSAGLGALANNGGPTQTMLPLAGSPAIDHGLNALIPAGITKDQRGYSRISNTTVDIGAVEVQATVLPTASIVATDATATEPNSASATATDTGKYTITRTGATTSALTVYLTLTGTATNGTDYTSLTSPVTIPAGAASTTITVTPKYDTTTESNETVIVTLSTNAAYTIDSTKKTATVNIVNTVPLPTISIVATDATATEPATSSAAATDTGKYTITRTGATTAALTVYLAMSGTGTNGTDYASIGTSVTIPAGAASTTITLTPKYDTSAESTETAIATLSANAAYQIDSTKTAATVNIVNVSPAFAQLVSGVLTINGTTAADKIALSLSGTTLTAKLNSLTPLTFSSTAVTSIKIYGLAGDDRISLGAGVRGSYIDGGDGNDVITGGSNNDTLLGNTGNDLIIGGLGSDSIDGGAGDDNLYCLDGIKDTVIGGAGSDFAQVDSTDVVSLVEDLLA